MNDWQWLNMKKNISDAKQAKKTAILKRISTILFSKQKLLIIAVLHILFASFLFDTAIFSLSDKLNSSMMTAIMSFLSSSLVISLFFIIISIFLLEKTHNFILIWASILFTSAVIFAVKLIVMRPRPFGQHFFLAGLPDYSFPSMHTALMFATVYVLWRSFPKEKWFFIIYAFLVGISRIYLHAHYASDVLFGAFMGFSIGYFVFLMDEKHKTFIKFKKRLNLD